MFRNAGVGPSGTGSYHGVHGFRAFSHQRSVMSRATWVDPSIRYPPYTEQKLKCVSCRCGPMSLLLAVCQYPHTGRCMLSCARFANMMLGGIKVPKPVLFAAAAAGTGALYYAFRSKL